MLRIKSMFKFTLTMGLCMCARGADAQETVLSRNGELNDVATFVLTDTVRKKSASGELTYPEELFTALAEVGISASITDWSCVHQKFSDFTEAFTTGGKKCFYSSSTLLRSPLTRF